MLWRRLKRKSLLLTGGELLCVKMHVRAILVEV